MEKIAGLRDILAHEYFPADLEVLWDIIDHKMPILKKQVAGILKIQMNHSVAHLHYQTARRCFYIVGGSLTETKANSGRIYISNLKNEAC